jgi:hypothetical protein
LMMSFRPIYYSFTSSGAGVRWWQGRLLIRAI